MSQANKSNPLGGQGAAQLRTFGQLVHAHALYQKALKKFPGDVDLWGLYFEWAKTT
ncbi:hypothetical protein BC830DRAFT_1106253 [Chytriomyces sp. MP71]|nr:hypothetical protein BC830DRAFT_1106253 [Chytriomyces sp. MP71]